MDLRTTPEQDELRAQCRAWLRANLPWEYGKGLPPHFDDLAEEVAFLRGWQRDLADAGWVGVTWPVEYGGRAAGPLDHYVVQEELARARAPELVGRIGINLVGPTLLAHGTDEQKQRWLAGHPAGAIALWCQLFSEPEAGSDLASLRTRATKVDGGWHVNGQKVWTSYAQFADWGLLLARTDADAPKHKGITAMAIDMHQPGVEVRPLRQITDETDFNEVFFTDAFVPDDHVVGEVNNGWRVSSSTLTHERGTNPRQLVIHAQLLEELLRLADRPGAVRRSSTAATAGRGLRRGASVPTAQLAIAVAPAERPRARARGQRPEAVLERDEQATARHGHGRARATLALVVGGRRQPRRRPVATKLAVLPVRLDLRGHERDPAHDHRRAGAGIAEGATMSADEPGSLRDDSLRGRRPRRDHHTRIDPIRPTPSRCR